MRSKELGDYISSDSYEGETRGWRMAKFLLGGAAGGALLFGLTIATPLVFRIMELNPISAGPAVISTVTVGVVLGGITGLLMEQFTWSRLRR